MINKYRVMLKGGRIVGPLTADKMFELVDKGHVSGNEDFQKFPGGKWGKLSLLPELQKILNSEKKPEEIKEKTKPIHAEDINYDGETPAQFNELKFSKDSLASKKPIRPEPPKVPIEEESDDEDTDKTQLARTRPVIQDDSDKTIINPLNMKIKKQEEEKKEKIAEEVPEEEPAVEEIDVIEEKDEKTEMLNISSLLPEIKNEVSEAESEFDIARRIEQEGHDKKLQEMIQDEEDEEDDEDDDEDEDESVNKKKKMKPIVAIAFLAVIWFLFDDDGGDKGLNAPRSLRIQFPISGEFLDEDQSNKEYKKGLNSYLLGTYESRILAANHFKKSLFYKYKENPALGQIILTYAELLPNTSNMREAGNTLYKLIKIARSKQLKDINVSMGTALFYYHFNKFYTSKVVLENYLRVSKPSVKFLGYYLMILLEVGDLTKAKQLYSKLESIKNKPLNVYISLSRYLDVIEERDKAYQQLIDARKVYGKSVLLLLEELKYTLRDQDYKKFARILKAIDRFKAEGSPVYYAKWLENMGVLKVLQNKAEQANKFFKLALMIKESDELRSKLSTLEMGGSNSTDSLILESKIIDLMTKAKKAKREKKWGQAFSFAIEASDLSETYIPSRLLLAQIQIKRGFFDSAITTLLKLRNEYVLNKNINYSLVMAYIESYKLAEAQREINNLSKTKFAKSSEYSSLMGRYYQKTGNTFLSLRWLSEAMAKNPISDEDFFLTAKILLKHRKYADSKRFLSDAISLDPINVEYRSLYGRILYELKGADVAIGYLRDLLESHKDHPMLLGDIARYYYQSGQMKEFELYKERIEASDVRDTSFYKFLIEAATSDDQSELVIKYSEELIKLNPGDLNTRINLGTYYYDMGRYKESLFQFEKVKNRLPAYPKVNYYLAKVKIAMGDIDDAIELAELEIKSNPTIEHGYYIIGAAYKKKKDWQNAIKYLEKAISRNPNSVETMSALAWIKLKQNYFAAARELYLRAIKEENSNASLHKDIGYVYKKMGQSGLAIESFNVYLQLSPGAKDESEIKKIIKTLSD